MTDDASLPTATASPAPDASAAAAPATAAAAPALLSTVVTLITPIKGEDGETITQVTVSELTLGQLKKAQASVKTNAERAAAVIAAVVGLPFDVASRIKLRDMNAISQARAGFVEPYMTAEADALANDTHTFDLLLPLKTDKGVSVPQLTATEPSIAAGVAVSMQHTQAAQDAAMIASSCGVRIQLINGLSERDATRIKVWLAPFAPDTTSKGEDGDA